ncbi:MAG: hypothetical protein KTR19_09450, partial [Hyphomicrobiales bacterium]|nr:hypothetical protein [Hyphomicrobiales bacterium]
VLKRRNALVFGSRGNIGRRLMKHLTDRLDMAGTALIGCDLKVNASPPDRETPAWHADPRSPAVPGCLEMATYDAFDTMRVRELDLIIGITGGPTPGHPVLQVKDVIDWLLNGTKRDLFLASGSSKTDEFPEILSWLDTLLSSQVDGVSETQIDGHAAVIAKQEIRDAVSGRNFGSRYIFTITRSENKNYTKSLLFLNNLLPVNFLFYGVPTEVIDEVLSQLLSAAITLRETAVSLKKARLYAVDYDRAASLGVYGSRPPASDLPRPLPVLEDRSSSPSNLHMKGTTHVNNSEFPLSDSRHAGCDGDRRPDS